MIAHVYDYVNIQTLNKAIFQCIMLTGGEHCI